MKFLFISFVISILLCIPEAHSKNNSIELGLLFNSDNAILINSSYLYNHKYKRIYFGIENGVIKGITGNRYNKSSNGEFKTDEVAVNFSEYFSLYSNLKLGYYLSIDENKDYNNGIVLYSSMGYSHWLSTKNDGGMYVSTGLDLIAKKYTFTFQYLFITNDLIKDNTFLKGGIRLNF